jgi:hypothetical protein
MKKIWMIVVVVSCVIGFSYMGFTQEYKCPMMDTGKGGPQGEKMCQGKMEGMGHGYGCKMMGGKALVATADGGVVVLCCNKLLKFDNNLVLQKEVALKIDKECQKKKTGKCPMSEQMKGAGDPKAETK